jgi:ATP-dependent Clp protease ATP-binding subunit ClpC
VSETNAAPEPPKTDAPSARERFDVNVRAIILKARASSERYKHTHVTPEHLLLGLLENNPTEVAALFNGASANPEQIRALIAHQLRPGTNAPSTNDPLGFSERAKRVLAAAEEEARRDGSEQARPKHLLLGLMAVGNTVCGAVLRAVDLDHDKIRNLKP